MNLQTVVDEKRSSGHDVPFVNWRYILFRWNDSDTEMDRARARATEIGVDRLCWEITDHPEDAFSRRFVPGADAYEAIRHEVWDDNNLGNAIPGATPRARITVEPVAPHLPLRAPSGGALTVRTRIQNLSTRAFPAQASYGRRLVRLGAQLCLEDGAVVDRDHARAWLPCDLDPETSATVPIDITAPSRRGRYVLKFDLVSEGIDWFEACGSDPTVRTLLVE